MIRGLRKIIYAACVIIVIIAFGTGYSLKQTLNTERSCIRTISYDHEVIYVLQGILSSLQRAESSRRGYVITGNREYVHNYNGAVGSVQQSIAYLKRLNLNGQYDDSFLDSLSSSINTRLATLKSSIELAMVDSTADSAQTAMTNAGMEAMSLIRGTILDLEREKRDSQDDTFQSLGKMNSTIQSLCDIGLFIAVLLAAVFAYLSSRQFRRVGIIESQLLRDLYQARQQVAHATSRYQDLKTEMNDIAKRDSGNAERQG